MFLLPVPKKEKNFVHIFYNITVNFPYIVSYIVNISIIFRCNFASRKITCAYISVPEKEAINIYFQINPFVVSGGAAAAGCMYVGSNVRYRT